MMKPSILLFLLTLEQYISAALSFSLRCPGQFNIAGASTALRMAAPDEDTDSEGADLAAQFFKMAQAKGISIDTSDYLDEEEEEEEEEFGDKLDEEEEPKLTDDKIFSEVKERVLDTAGGFVELVGGAREDDDDEDDTAPKEYQPPSVVPDVDLTAGEVVLLVLEALKNNDNPTPNKGVEILFGYSSSSSQIMNEEGLTPKEYADFLKETEYKVLFDHEEVMIDKGKYSFDGKKAFLTARLRIGPGPKDFTSCNFILTTEGKGDDAAWLVESMLIRPESMRRRRRK